jgi:hypothetical protein
VEPVGGVGRHVDRLSGSRRDLFTAEGHLNLTFEDAEHFLEVVAVWRRTATWGNVHVDQRVLIVGVAARD